MSAAFDGETANITPAPANKLDIMCFLVFCIVLFLLSFTSSTPPRCDGPNRHNLYKRLCTAASGRRVRQDPGTRSSSPGRTALSATGSAAAGASASATRLADREPQASCREIASPDSFDRSDSCSLAGRAAADSTPFPYQAPAVGLQWLRAGDPRQR